MKTFQEYVKDRLVIEAGLTFTAPFRGSSRKNLDPKHSGSYQTPFGPTDSQIKSDNEKGIWQYIHGRIKNNDCSGAEESFKKLKQDYLLQGEIEKAKQAEKGFTQNVYGKSFCPISKLIDDGDCENAFSKLSATQDQLKTQGKERDAKNLDKLFWDRWNVSRCDI